MTEFTKTFRRTTYPTIAPSSPANDHAGRTVLITGGSAGIGRGIARAFAAANASKIIIVARNGDPLNDAAKGITEDYPNVDVCGLSYDCASHADIEALWKEITDKHLFIDVCVIGASATQPPKTLEDQVAMIQFNMIASLIFLERFREQANPSKRPLALISISSATIHCYPYQAVTYAATKAGFANYLCHIADFIPENEMRMINYHPGAVYTEAADKAGEVPKDLPIWDHPSLSADMAVWLAGKDSAFLHGRYVWANWDADELMEMRERILADPAYLKVGITGVDSYGVKDLMEVCGIFPAPKSSVS